MLPLLAYGGSLEARPEWCSKADQKQSRKGSYLSRLVVVLLIVLFCLLLSTGGWWKLGSEILHITVLWPDVCLPGLLPKPIRSRDKPFVFFLSPSPFSNYIDWSCLMWAKLETASARRISRQTSNSSGFRPHQSCRSTVWTRLCWGSVSLLCACWNYTSYLITKQSR